MLCIVETDLHSRMSRHKRNISLTRKEICNILRISGYNIHLPATWKQHGQARLIVYAKEELIVKEICLQASLTDLPLITFEIGFAKERKTIVNYFYREFTNGVTGSRAAQDQLERLTRMTNYWRSLTDSNKDVVCLGNANLCAVKWNDADYHMKEHA